MDDDETNMTYDDEGNRRMDWELGIVPFIVRFTENYVGFMLGAS